MVEIRSGHEFHNEILASYTGHHLFHWVRPRDVWFQATKPVFFDFGDDYLWRLEMRHVEHGVRTIRRTMKTHLALKNGGDASALSTTGESPIDEQVAPAELRALWASRDAQVTGQ